MKEQPTVQADLARRPLADLLGAIRRDGLSGTLRVEAGGETIADLVVGAGRIAAADGDALEAVRRAAARTDGSCTLRPGTGEAAGAGASLLDAILAAARAIPEGSPVAEWLGGLDAAPAPAAQPAEGAALGPQEGFLLSRVDGSTCLRDICQLSPAAEEETLRAVFGLLCAGFLRAPGPAAPDRPAAPPPAPPKKDGLSKLDGFLRRTATGVTPRGGTPGAGPAPPRPAVPPAAPAAAPPAGARPAPPTRREATSPPPERKLERVRGGEERQRLEERLRVAGSQNFYQLLGARDDAPSDEIRRIYYTLARKFHPDRFHTPDLRDLHPALEKLFGRMTEAYQVLSEADSRRAYDDSLRKGKTDGRSSQEAASQEMAREYFRRGRALVAEGQFVKAYSLLESAVKYDASRADHLEALGGVQALNPRYKVEAEANLKGALKLEPTRASAHVLLGLYYARYGRLVEAQRDLKAALGWDAGNAAAQEALAAVESKSPKLGEEATEALRALLKRK